MKRAPTRDDLSAEQLREILSYEPSTGMFRWKVSTGATDRKGKIAGSISRSGSMGLRYLRVTINGKRYQGHRLAWLYIKGVWPDRLVDHRDGNPLNNRFDNLRLASHVENTRNNSTRGYCFSGGRYVAYVYVGGKQIVLGRFDNEDHARTAREAGTQKYFGEFSPSNRGI